MSQSGPSGLLGGSAHYMQSSVWAPENFLQSESERKRFKAVMSLVPSGISSLLDVGAGNGAFLRCWKTQRLI